MTTTKHFAFYGRVSTEDQQDPTSSRNWQLARSRQVIEAVGGEVVEEFFDIGQSRSLPWKRRPEALRLLDTFRDPNRGFDAVVIGEPQRAFYGHQFGLTFPVLVHYGIGLWVPEVGGAVDPGSEAHDLVMSLYGGMSKGERTRIKTRVRAAMAAQAAIEGRFLGGRPPYGYLLVDAGVHPNPAKAAIGQRLHALAPDPIAAPVVQRIFAKFIAGSGLHSIARDLTHDGVTSPSGHDPARNPHRVTSRGLWAKSAVRAILANPRYTGFEVWNKQRKDEILIDVEDVSLGHETRMRWNDTTQWVWSQEPVHEPIITLDTFQAAQAVFGQNTRVRRTPTEGRSYQLAGLMRCGKCGRRMQGQWNHDKAYYRCKFTEYYPGSDDHPKSIYVKEAAIVGGLNRFLNEKFNEDVERTVDALAGHGDVDPTVEQRHAAIREQIAKCDQRLAKYRAALDEPDAELGPFIKWIAEVERERKALQAQLGRAVPGGKLDKTQLRALVEALRDIVGLLADADDEDRKELYQQLGISLTYHPDGKVLVEALPRGVMVRVGGATQTPSTWDPWVQIFATA